jgi:hypothetical protein
MIAFHSPAYVWGSALLLTLSLVGCSSSTPPATHVKSANTGKTKATKHSKRAIPQGHLRREDVLSTLSAGPPEFLKKIDVEPVFTHGGKFVGWKLLGINDPEWEAKKLTVGDVIVRVNGKHIQTDYEFYDVFTSLAFAKELRLRVARQGRFEEVVFPINDGPGQSFEMPKDERLAKENPKQPASTTDRPLPSHQTPGKPKNGSRWQVKTIGGGGSSY